jgi:hypothetical protein
MWPGDFVRLLQEHKHPRFWSCGIISTRFGNNPRKRAGYDEGGTVWFATVDHREPMFAVPCNQIPYWSIETAEWDEKFERWKGPSPAQGWRGALVRLLSTGHLRPSPKLSYLIGEDSFAVCPKEYHVL